ncbi:MAG: ComEC/Rec2 family competence protein [Solirubrobacterales bacterium]
MAACTIALVLVRPRGTPGAAFWLALVAIAGAGAGLLLGTARLQAIDSGGYGVPAGERIAVRGHVSAVPRRRGGTVRVRVETANGRLAIEAPEPVPDLAVGAELRATGTVARPSPWLEDDLRRNGIARILRADAVELTGERRGGIEGRIDRIRIMAEEALGRGMPAEQAALARGFVLGQDDRISPRTIEDFQRSGLAHLLAVSGQNVVLLALLAAPLLAALGIPLRARLAWLLALVALYVPLAGGGPSIQRAGAMGAAAIVATLAGRPASRIYALLLAAVATLALNPRAGADVGWQLSFAAVVGIFVAVRPLRDLVLARIGDGGWRRGLADGVAVTLAATLATAPLMAHHFEAFSVTSLAANVAALPAVAPAMWLGMLAAALGQLPGFPVEPLNWVNSLLLAYIGQIATWMAGPEWALAGLRTGSWTVLLAAYAALLAAALALRRWAGGRRGLRVRDSPGSPRALWLALAALAALTIVAVAGLPAGRESGAAPPAGLRVSVLDVGQGDSILLQPPDGGAVLVDGGPPGGGLTEELSRLGVESLAAAVLTHDQSDHAGGIEELLGSLAVGRLVYAAARPSLLGAARAAGAAPVRIAGGGELRSGSLRLEALWPPRVLLDGVLSGDPNARSLVLLARWHNFEMLLTGDAEAEVVPIDPGPLDVLKVSHHGSADAGLAELLDRTAPRLAVISVGEDNPFGHPDPGILASLASHEVRVLRTDRAGTVTIEAGEAGSEVTTGR